MEHIEETIRGEWHWITAYIGIIAHVPFTAFEKPDQPRAIIGKVSHLFIQRSDTGGSILMKCTATDGSTLVTADCEDAVAVALCRDIIEKAHQLAERAREYGRSSERLTADDAIEWYYRSRARGRKTTLKQAAQRYGFNESYVRQAKIEYDKAGKWGAKSKVKPENT